MSYDMLIPFGILLILVVYLLYTRSKFEKDIVQLYEKKFDEWKSTNTSTQSEKKEPCKKLVGLVFKENYKVSIELLDDDARSGLERGKFTIDNLKG